MTFFFCSLLSFLHDKFEINFSITKISTLNKVEDQKNHHVNKQAFCKILGQGSVRGIIFEKGVRYKITMGTAAQGDCE